MFATLSRPEMVGDFDQAITAIPQVIEAQRLFGEPDYLLRIVAASPAAYQQLYDHTLARLPGVQGLRSTILMKQVIPSTPCLPEPGRQRRRVQAALPDAKESSATANVIWTQRPIAAGRARLERPLSGGLRPERGIPENRT